jgi:hypothetical protein
MRLVALLVPATAARARVNGPRRVRRMRIGLLRVELSPEAPVDREIVSELLRCLLGAGFSIERVSPVAVSLEQRFLTMTRGWRIDPDVRPATHRC